MTGRRLTKAEAMSARTSPLTTQERYRRRAELCARCVAGSCKECTGLRKPGAGPVRYELCQCPNHAYVEEK